VIGSIRSIAGDLPRVSDSLTWADRLIYLKNVVSLHMDGAKCVGCGMCLVVCPHEVFYQENGSVQVQNRDACMECGAFAKNCPVSAINVDSGVGCAAAVINAALGRKNASCCCINVSQENSEVSAGRRNATCR
jgi:NAD-dependent dihydropyrimidine dehydrogenase PreA subunit